MASNLIMRKPGKRTLYALIDKYFKQPTNPELAGERRDQRQNDLKPTSGAEMIVSNHAV